MFLNKLNIILIVIFIILISGYYIIYNKFKTSKIRKFELLVSYLSSIYVFLVIYSIYLQINSENLIEKNRLVYNTIQNVNSNFIQPQKDLLEYYPEGYFLYASMNPETDLSKSMPHKFDPVKRKQLEIYSSSRIFQAVEDFLSTGTFDITGNAFWINVFLMWFQSPILQENWKSLSANYAHDTRELINNIIPKSNSLVDLRNEKGKLTQEDYDNISQKFIVKLR